MSATQTMLSEAEVTSIALDIAKRHFAKGDVEHAVSARALDADGDEAFRITVIIRPGALERADADAVVDAVVDIRGALEKAGDYRFPYLRYVTRADLAADHGDS